MTFSSCVPFVALTSQIISDPEPMTSVTRLLGRSTLTSTLETARRPTPSAQTTWTSRSSGFGSATWAANPGAVRTAAHKHGMIRVWDMAVGSGGGRGDEAADIVAGYSPRVKHPAPRTKKARGRPRGPGRLFAWVHFGGDFSPSFLSTRSWIFSPTASPPRLTSSPILFVCTSILMLEPVGVCDFVKSYQPR